MVSIAHGLLVALLSLPLLAGSASAECAWVLWLHGMYTSSSGQSRDEWTPLGAYETY